jgi:hypothetical protein
VVAAGYSRDELRTFLRTREWVQRRRGVHSTAVTTVARTLVDCAREWDLTDAVVALDDGLRRGLTDPAQLRQAVSVVRHREGTSSAARAVGLAQADLGTTWPAVRDRLRDLLASPLIGRRGFRVVRTAPPPGLTVPVLPHRRRTHLAVGRPVGACMTG